jgi:hypothetical protein
MFDVFSITLPIFILIALGFAATRFGTTTPSDIQALGVFVLQYALPALVFKSLAQRPFGEIANGDYLLVYTVGSGLAFALMLALARALRPGDPSGNAIQALGSSASNSGFVGYPIALLMVGPSASVALALSMVTENAVIIPLALTLAETAAGGGENLAGALRHIGRQLSRNPLIIAIVLGGAASLLGAHLPAPLAKAVDMLSMASAAIALFVVGGTLVGLKIGGVVSDVGRIVAGKLILHPLAIFAALTLAPSLDPDLRKSMLILASSPMLSIFPLLGRRFGQERVGAAALMAATGLSFLTISALLLLL